MEPGTLVLCLATQDALYEKMLSNIQEIKARGAHVLATAKEGNRAGGGTEQRGDLYSGLQG